MYVKSISTDLVFEPSVLLIWHHSMAEREQAKEVVDVPVAALHRIEQCRIEELELRLVFRVKREIQRL